MLLSEIASKRRLYSLAWRCSVTFSDYLLQEFLARTHELYEMHIYTHGNKEYAQEMAKLLDPTKRFFAERIISQVILCPVPMYHLAVEPSARLSAPKLHSNQM